MNPLDKKDLLGIAMTIFFGLVVLNMTSCVSLVKVPDTPQVLGRGQCFWYDSLERKAKSKSMCWEHKQVGWITVFCTLHKNHSSKHHSHSMTNDCRAIWK